MNTTRPALDTPRRVVRPARNAGLPLVAIDVAEASDKNGPPNDYSSGPIRRVTRIIPGWVFRTHRQFLLWTSYR